MILGGDIVGLMSIYIVISLGQRCHAVEAKSRTGVYDVVA